MKGVLMVLDKEAFMSSLKSRLGDDTSDDAMTFLENMSDTYNDLLSKTSTETSAEAEEWHRKYDEVVKEKAELDENWRQKYRDRFFSSDDGEDDDKGGEEPPKVVTSFDDLFTVKGD